MEQSCPHSVRNKTHKQYAQKENGFTHGIQKAPQMAQKARQRASLILWQLVAGNEKRAPATKLRKNKAHFAGDDGYNTDWPTIKSIPCQ